MLLTVIHSGFIIFVYSLFLFLNPHLKILFTDFLGREEGRERERNIGELAAIWSLSGNQTHIFWHTG